MNSNSRAIHIEGLTRYFGELCAVEGLTCSVGRGELFGMVGPDGAGKTTTLRMLAGVLRPTAGDAILNGISVANNPEGVKHEIAYMSQRFGLYTDLTVLENLNFYADLYQVPQKERAARMDRLFQFSNLGPFKQRMAGKLSGGMKQKLGLSCALIHQPKFLLLDEPTFGIDPISRRDLWLIVHQMVAQGVTAVVSTAYMDEAERFDRVALFHKGRMLGMDTPEALQRSLEGEMVMIQVENVREARDHVSQLPMVRRAIVFGDRLHVTVSSSEREGPAVKSLLLQAGFQVQQMCPVLPTMEDVFMEKVAKAEARE
jgi:ABC-2 type transport system ATP-binding protein